MKMSDLWKSIKNIVEKVAPVLGNAILPGVGGTAGALLAQVLGGDSSNPEELLKKVQNMTPEQIAAVQAAADKHEEVLLGMSVERDKMYLADTASARTREVEMTKATGRRDLNLYVLAWTVVTGFFGLCVALMKMTLPPGSNDVIYMLFGALVGGFTTVLGYFFGSSKGSADKNVIIEELKK